MFKNPATAKYYFKKIKYSQWYLGKFCLVFLRFKKNLIIFNCGFFTKVTCAKVVKNRRVEKERNRSKQVEKNSEIKNKLTMEVQITIQNLSYLCFYLKLWYFQNKFAKTKNEMHDKVLLNNISVYFTLLHNIYIYTCLLTEEEQSEAICFNKYEN